MKKSRFLHIAMLITAVIYIQPGRILCQDNVASSIGKLTLSQAIQIGLSNNPSLQIADLQTGIAANSTDRSRRDKLPDIYGSFDIRRNIITPTTPVPAYIFNPDAGPDDITPLRFATDWTGSAGINFSYNLFNPQKNATIKENAQKEQISSIDASIARNDLKYRIEGDYLTCLITGKQVELAITDTVRQHRILQITYAQYQAGKLEISDLNRIIAEKLTAVNNLSSAVKIHQMSKAQLLLDMGLDPEKFNELMPADSLESLMTGSILVDTISAENLALRKIEMQQALNNLQTNTIRQSLYPTISLEGFAGTNYYDNKFRLLNHHYWYGNSYIGLGIDIPVSDYWRKSKDIQSLQLEHRTLELEYQKNAADLSLQKIKATQEVAFKEKELLSKKEKYRLMEVNLRSDTAKFESGRLLTSDLIQSNFLFSKAKTEYLQVLYELLSARINLNKILHS